MPSMRRQSSPETATSTKMLELTTKIDSAAAWLVKRATHLPRGRLFIARLLTKWRPNLRSHAIETRYGTIVCDLSESVCQPLLRYGRYQHWEADEEALSRIPLDRDSVVLDVGANLGILTRLFARRAGHVHAFEPAPRAIRLLQANAGNLSNVTIHQFAISDTVGTAVFEQREALDTSSLGTGEGITVHTRTIDSLALRPKLVKIDVEGFEDRVLRGARRTINESRPIIMFEALSADARERCIEAILGASPGYRIEAMGGGTNFIAWPPD